MNKKWAIPLAVVLVALSILFVGYLNDNPQYIWKDIPNIPNINKDINTEDIKEANSCLSCCGKCFKCCCCKRKV